MYNGTISKNNDNNNDKGHTMEHTVETPAGTVHIRERAATHRRIANKPRIYASVPDFNLLEDLTNRNRRPFRQWRKLVNDAIMASGIGVDTARMGWDQRAGCGCGCSPGFVLDNHNSVVIGTMAFHNYDVFVTLPKEAPAVDESLPARELVVTDEPAESTEVAPELELAGAL